MIFVHILFKLVIKSIQINRCNVSKLKLLIVRQVANNFITNNTVFIGKTKLAVKVVNKKRLLIKRRIVCKLHQYILRENCSC